MTSYKKIYLQIESKTQKVENTSTKTHYFYDRSTRKMQKIDATALKYRFDYKIGSLKCEGLNIKHTYLQKTNNLEQIQSFIDEQGGKVIVNDSLSDDYSICIEVDRKYYDEVTYDLDASRIKYDI